MRLSDYLAIGIIIVLAYLIVTNKPTIETQIEYIKGDTITVIETITKIDTVYKYSYLSNVDTIKLKDTIYLAYSTNFNLGDSVLGTSGKVSFDLLKFDFTNIKYRYPEKTKTITDTLKITNQIENPFYLNNWFYIASGLIIILLSLLT